MRNVSSTPLNWRTKTTSKKKPTAIRMYRRYVETTSFLTGTPVSDRGLYGPQYTSGGKFTVHRPLCIIVPQYARGKRAEGSICWAEARGPVCTPSEPEERHATPPAQPAHRRPRRAPRGPQGEQSQRLPQTAHHGRWPFPLFRAGARLRGARSGPGRGGARGPHRPWQRSTRYGAGGGRGRRDLHAHSTGEPHGAWLPPGGREPRRDGASRREPLREPARRPFRQRVDAREDPLPRDGRGRTRRPPDGRPRRRRPGRNHGLRAGDRYDHRHTPG